MSLGPGRRETVHASCVVLGEIGILIRGSSGAGKSTLARRLVDDVARSDRYAALVGDDRVVLGAAGGRVIARPAARLAGLIEVRGVGLVPVPSEPACVLRLVVDIVPPGDVPRLPERSDGRTELLGVALPPDGGFRLGGGGLVLWRIRGTHDTWVTEW